MQIFLRRKINRRRIFKVPKLQTCLWLKLVSKVEKCRLLEGPPGYFFSLMDCFQTIIWSILFGFDKFDKYTY